MVAGMTARFTGTRRPPSPSSQCGKGASRRCCKPSVSPASTAAKLASAKKFVRSTSAPPAPPASQPPDGYGAEFERKIPLPGLGLGSADDQHHSERILMDEEQSGADEGLLP